MISKFRLELDVVLDTEIAPVVIQAARHYYAAKGGLTAMDENGTLRTLNGEEFISEIEDALLKLLERNPAPKAGALPGCATPGHLLLP